MFVNHPHKTGNEHPLLPPSGRGTGSPGNDVDKSRRLTYSTIGTYFQGVVKREMP
jgi:hypothetical protein